MIERLTDTVRRSRASRNSFFSKCREQARLRDPGCVIARWAPVTRAYCLGLARYTAELAARAERAEPAAAGLWESALLVPVHLFAEEMSHGNRGRDGIHFRMFEKLAAAWPDTSAAIDDDTQELVQAIHRSLADVFAGAGSILVVEMTASDIVAAFHELLLASDRQGRTRVRPDREYIDLHLRTEPAHAARAVELVAWLSQLEEGRDEIERGVEVMSARFGAYWESLAASTFV